MRLETIVLIVGLLLSAYCLLVAIKPEWFKNFSIIRRDSDGDYRGSTRLGDLPVGLVRVLYVGVAGVLLVATFVITGFARQDRVCDDAKAVFDVGRKRWSDQAAASDHVLRTVQKGSLTRYELVKDGTTVATWSDAGWGLQFTCPPES